MDNLAIVICATSRFQYCLAPQARAIKQNATLAGINSGHLILVTDEKDGAGILGRYAALLEGWTIHHLALPIVEPEKKDYGKNSQLLISQLYTAGFDKARALDASHVWTLEADVIPEANNLRCMRDMLNFDGGYYDVSFCPYVSAGGGGIMGGRGTANNWILPNWTEDELALPEELAERLKEHRAKHQGGTPSPEWIEEMRKLDEEAKKYPPKGNVFKLNGERWRKRGWLEWAYPGIGKGAVLPSDWLPMGNNLFSRRALNFLDFTGYSGSGTQDLYLSYLRLASNGLKFCVLPHSPSHHVIRKQNADGGAFTMFYLHHEQEGECAGHLRQRELPFYSHEAGETINANVITTI
ncbi:MAG: hypothetical protein P4L99_01345 [Chthoniobacter sp.]|nr:hypothetical protein [Chthoniobacter sp.]